MLRLKQHIVTLWLSCVHVLWLTLYYMFCDWLLLHVLTDSHHRVWLTCAVTYSCERIANLSHQAVPPIPSVSFVSSGTGYNHNSDNTLQQILINTYYCYFYGFLNKKVTETYFITSNMSLELNEFQNFDAILENNKIWTYFITTLVFAHNLELIHNLNNCSEK